MQGNQDLYDPLEDTKQKGQPLNCNSSVSVVKPANKKSKFNALRKVDLKAFADIDDGESETTSVLFKKDNDGKCIDVVETNGFISTSVRNTILKTAAWVSEHPEMIYSAEGKLFADELSRCNAEKDVKNVMYGIPVSIPSILTPPQLSSLPCVTSASSSYTVSQPGGMIDRSVLDAAVARAAAYAQSMSSVTPSTTISVAEAKESQIASTSGLVSGEVRKRKSRWGEASSAPTSTAVPSGISPPCLAPGGVIIPVPIISTPSVSKTTANKSTNKDMEAAMIAEEVKKLTEDVGVTNDISWLARAKEQLELQLVESRIRDASRLTGFVDNRPGGFLLGQRDMITAGDGSNTAHHHHHPSSMKESVELLNATLSAYVERGSEHESLYLERLREYDELAQRYDADFKDTVDDAERNGGVIEGGTWEHRRRAQEMLTTAARNLELTARSSNAHHIADFLPQAELDKFLDSARATVSGSHVSVVSDFADSKLTTSNIGYQMLKNAGWTEGSGLGLGLGVVPGGLSTSSNPGAGIGVGSGILEPINMHAQSVSGAGIGTHATHEVQVNDNDYDQYRKRMMLAYRFRPNPLNNPRRNYY